MSNIPPAYTPQGFAFGGNAPNRSTSSIPGLSPYDLESNQPSHNQTRPVMPTSPRNDQILNDSSRDSTPVIVQAVVFICCIVGGWHILRACLSGFSVVAPSASEWLLKVHTRYPQIFFGVFAFNILLSLWLMARGSRGGSRRENREGEGLLAAVRRGYLYT